MKSFLPINSVISFALSFSLLLATKCCAVSLRPMSVERHGLSDSRSTFAPLYRRTLSTKKLLDRKGKEDQKQATANNDGKKRPAKGPKTITKNLAVDAPPVTLPTAPKVGRKLSSTPSAIYQRERTARMTRDQRATIQEMKKATNRAREKERARTAPIPLSESPNTADAMSDHAFTSGKKPLNTLTLECPVLNPLYNSVEKSQSQSSVAAHHDKKTIRKLSARIWMLMPLLCLMLLFPQPPRKGRRSSPTHRAR